MAPHAQHRHPKLSGEAGRRPSARGGRRALERTRLYALVAVLVLAGGALLVARLRARSRASAPPVAGSSVPLVPPVDPALAARIPGLEAAVASAPSDTAARVRLAEAYLDARRPLDAVEVLQQTADKDGQVHLLLGRAYADCGDVARAEEHLRAARAAMPEAAEPSSRLGLLLASTGRLEGGVALCRDVAAAHPEDYGALVRFARVQILSEDMGRGGQEEARPALERAIALRPDEAEAYVLMARAQVLYPDEALTYAAKAVELDPRSAESYEVLGWLHYLRGATGESLRLAEDAFTKGLALDPDNVSMRFNLGMVYARAGRDEESVRELEQAMALAPGAKEIWWALASAYKRAGRDEEAAEIRRYMRLASDFREEEARRRLDIAYGPSDPSAYVRMAEFYLKYGNKGLAATAARRALELDPDDEAAARVLRAASGVVP